MVKGISRQVILVRPQNQKLFEQAIFILRQDSPEVTEEQLLKEADRLLTARQTGVRSVYGPVWAGAGALVTGVLWLLSGFF